MTFKKYIATIKTKKYACYTCGALQISTYIKKKKRQVTTTINGNMTALQYIITKISEVVKKVCGPQEGHCEKSCEIQGGSQEMAVVLV